MRDAVMSARIRESMDAIPIERFRAGLGSNDPQLREAIVAASDSVSVDEAARIAETTRQQSAMGRHPDQWSRFEHPVASDLLMDAAQRIEAVIAAFAAPRSEQSDPVRWLAGDLAWSLPEHLRPAIGTLSTGQFTASTYLVPDGGIVILVENGLFPFARNLAQVGVLGYQEALEDGRLSEPTVQSICDVAATYVALGHTMNLPPRPTPPALQEYVAAVEDAIVVFVLAHEYAHILNGDFDAHPLGDSRDRELGPHRLEHDADSAGLRIALAATATPDLGGAALWGATAFLAGLDVLLRADAAAAHEAPVVEDDPGGPTPFERARHLAETIEQSVLLTVFDEALGAALNVYQTVLFAWDVIMPALWAIGDLLRAPSNEDRLTGYDAEVRQWAAMRLLWADVQPRVATQRQLR
jgi:hypothetical protein